MLAVVDWAAVIIGIGALFTAIGGVITAYASVRRAHTEGEDAAEKRIADTRAALNATREEAEQAEAELHKWHMRFPEGIPD